MVDVRSVLALLALAVCGPVGKTFIKKSTEYEDPSKKRFLKLFGLLFLLFFSPAATMSSYYFADNAIVAPVGASAVLFNILFVGVFKLDEGNRMNKTTIVGMLAFVAGLFLMVFTYSDLAGNDVSDDDLEWGALSLYFGIWILSITLLTNTIQVLNQNSVVQLVGWSVVAGLLSGVDIVASMDEWIYNHERENWNELGKGILAMAFYTISGILSIFIISNLLLDPDNPMHIVATIWSSVKLFCDVIADLFVFQRYTRWGPNNYAMALIGLLFMIIGIIILQTNNAENKEQVEPEEETELLLKGTIGVLAPPPSLQPKTQ